MTPLFVFAVFVLLIGWVFSEFSARTPSWLRVSLGLAAMLVVGWLSSFASTIIPQYESDFHRSAMKELGEMFKEKRLNQAERAVERYNKTIEEEDSTYTAAMDMLQEMNVGRNSSE
ncbi:hypothetical protein [Roseibacillus persicicus]|uniref:hypothetical protein n=1 Tax=Roseibacillus persicicus TaxID=454148 RepID=UPI002810EF2F|nr:hypothetical protein [Roseibacillus persicicus]